MSDRSSIFDMIGPVMIGPSSSHTAGVVRIGRVARQILGEQPDTAHITFYNSFARTYEGHGSDRAVLAGLLDLETDDERIRRTPEISKKVGMNYQYRAVTNASAFHPNTIKIKANSGRESVEIMGISRGGGLISIIEVDGFRCNFTAQQHTLIVSAQDVPGSVAFIATVLNSESCNIATMTVDRRGKSDLARLVIEMDSGIRPLAVKYMESQDWIARVIYIPNITI